MHDGWSIKQCISEKQRKDLKNFISALLPQKWVGGVQKKGAFDASIAKIMLTNYFEKTMQSCKERIAAVQDSCHYLTANDELLVVQMCTVLGYMGYGLSHHDLHEIADTIVKKDIDEWLCIPISMHVADGLLLHHKELVKIVAAVSLDPKRTGQATSDTRDAMFSKLNSYIQLLFAMGEVPWRTYNDILPDSI